MTCRKNQHKLCGIKSCNICFERSFASYIVPTKTGNILVESWNYEKNSNLTPLIIKKNDNKKYWFKCINCFHGFEKVISSISRGQDCSFCSTGSIILCDNPHCIICFNKSFSSYNGKTHLGNRIIDYWNYEKNILTPRDIMLGSSKNQWFDCDKCPHSFEKIITAMTVNDTWCPYCANQIMCHEKNCKICYEKSFASFNGENFDGMKMIDCWNYEKNKLIPRMVFKSSNKTYHFVCKNCPHSFSKVLSSLTNGGKCPYCVNKKICFKKECLFCFNNSFASFEGETPNGKLIVDCWDYERNNTIPRNIFKCCGNKYYFKCDKCPNIFGIQINNIVCGNQWCGLCFNKTEEKFFTYFTRRYNIELKHQGIFEWCKINKRFLPFDFVVEEFKIIIEIDGEQHFSQVRNWQSSEVQNERDIFKIEKALEKGYTIIRILQEDIWFNRNNWRVNFLKYFRKYKTPRVICIGCEIKYKKFLAINS